MMAQADCDIQHIHFNTDGSVNSLHADAVQSMIPKPLIAELNRMCAAPGGYVVAPHPWKNGMQFRVCHRKEHSMSLSEI